jgi:subtilisin family serine protease
MDVGLTRIVIPGADAMYLRGRRIAPGPSWVRKAVPVVAAAAVTLALATTRASQPARPRFVPLPPVEQRERPQFSIASVETATDLIRVIPARDRFQVDGSGLAVAVLDTGLNLEHDDFAGDGRILAHVNLTKEDASDPDKVTDVVGHGSNVGGIVVAHGMHPGVARGANIVPVKIVDNSGRCDAPDIERGLKWVLDNHERYKISVAVIALGFPENLSDDSAIHPDFEPIRALVRKLRAERVPVVVAAGNSYFTYNSVPATPDPKATNDALQGMSIPAIFRETVSVGAVFDSDSDEWVSFNSGAIARKTRPDWLTPFSQRLDEATGKKCRTDVFAPGSKINSSGRTGKKSESIHDGTSQAAPFVAGVILLIQQLHLRQAGKLPCVDDIECWLRTGAVTVTDDGEDDNVKHTRRQFLRIDAVKALDLVKGQPCAH